MPRPIAPRSISKLGLRNVSLLTLLLFVVLVGGVTQAFAADWELNRDAEGIKVFTRPVADSGIKEFKGIAEIESPAEDIVSFIRDSDHFKDWFPSTPESKLLDRKGAVSYQYSVMDAPWPVSDRDNVLRSVLERDATSGAIQINVTAAPDFYPEQPDRVRVQKARGFWRIEPLETNRSRVTFSMHLEPGGGVPEWLSNTRVVETPYEALTNLRASVKR